MQSGTCILSCPPPPPGGTNLSLTYGYQASAGQMGTGSTAGNAGQLMSMTGTIGGMTESASYTYDLLGRVATSNQKSNGQNAQRRFAYDRWGNRTGVFDPGNHDIQIQSIALEESGGAPTNRITSVTAGSTVNYVYDAAGNVTNDGIHSYAYDSENRQVSVDGGSTAQYSYDHQNRRYKKTIGSIVTHYVWEGSKVLGEYNGSTGGLQVNYWYAGERLFKKTGVTAQVFLSDRLSVRLALSDIGVVAGRQGHLPFGEDFAESGTQDNHHFTSYERDTQTGLDYAVNRYFAATVARFATVDPLPGQGGDGSGSGCTANQKAGKDEKQLPNPQSWDTYSYSFNDPVNRTDPTGLWPCGSDGWISPVFVGNWWDLGAFANIWPRINLWDLICMNSWPLAPFWDPFGGNETCGECCASAWDVCWDLFLMELGLVGTAGQAAFECFQECRGNTGRLAACMSVCLVRKQIGRQKQIERAVKHFFECLGAQSRTCQSNIPDCWCPWM